MLTVLVVVCLLVALGAGAAAALIVLPAPSYNTAMLAVAASEKSFVPAGLALLTALVAWLAVRPRHPILGGFICLLGLASFGVSLIPPVQALSLAQERGTPLSWQRYVASVVDNDIGKAPSTFEYTNVGGHKLSVDVYPAAGAQAGEPRRAIVVVHGGGWSKGDKGEASLTNAWLASQGFHVFDIQYRLVPGARWKEATGDVKCAIGWVKRVARDRLGSLPVTVDPDRVALLGRSAGGHLALLAAFTTGAPELPPSCAEPDTGVDAVMAFYAPTDLRWGFEHTQDPAVYDTGERIRDLMGGTPGQLPEAYDQASPTFRAHASAPPVLLVHGGQDQFVSPEHMHRLHARLDELGVVNDTLLIPYARHGFDYVYDGPGGQLTEGAILSFLKQVERGKHPAVPPARTAADGGAPAAK